MLGSYWQSGVPVLKVREQQMQGLHGFQKSMERPLDPVQHTTPCSRAQQRDNKEQASGKHTPDILTMEGFSQNSTKWGEGGRVTLPIHRAERDDIKYSTS